MAQQVVHAIIKLASQSPMVSSPTFGITIEQQGTSSSLNLTTVTTKLTDFINTAYTGAVNPPAAYFSKVLSRVTNASQITYYDVTAHLDGTSAGSPIGGANFTLGPIVVSGGVTALPEGCAMMIGFRGSYGTDVEFGPGTRPRARDRGRFYLGPMVNLVVQDATTGRMSWNSSSILPDMAAAISGLTTGSGTTDVPMWVQWSQKNAHVANIVDTWIDDAPRYQRRRAKGYSKLY